MSRCSLWQGAAMTGLLAISLVLAGVRPASADPVISFNEATGSSGSNQAQSVGWIFDVVSPIDVTGLGWFDENLDGLGHEHPIGIWRSDGSLVTEALLPGGTTAGLDGQYRVIPVTPVILPVGAGYTLGGENFINSVDRLAYDVTQTVDARIHYVDAVFANIGSGYARPTQPSVATTGFYGPVFTTHQFGGAPIVPEPASMALLATGALPLLGRLRRRRR